MEKKKITRRYDLDWIRSLVVLSIIFYHVCDMFILNKGIIIFEKADHEIEFCRYMQMFLARWHMVILFIISGMSVFYALNKKAPYEFLKSRVSKLLMPMILGCIFLNPLTSYIYGLSIGRKESFTEQIYLFFTSISDKLECMTTGFGPMHLWFMLYLFVFTCAIIPVHFLFSKFKQTEMYSRFVSFLTKPYRLLLICLPYPFIFWIFNILGERNPAAYFYVFIIGYIMSTDERFQEAIDRDKKFYTVLSVISIVVFYYLEIHCNYDTVNQTFTIASYIVKLCKMTICFAIMGIAHSYIPQKKSELLSRMSSISFPVYIVHMPIMTFIAYEIFKLNISCYLQFTLIIFLSYTIVIAVCVLYKKLLRCSRGACLRYIYM